MRTRPGRDVQERFAGAIPRITMSREAVINTSGVWLPLVTLGVYSATAAWSGPVLADTYGTGLEAWTLANTGEPWLDGLLPDGLDLPQGEFPNWLFVEADGHAVSTRTIGVVLAALPFSLLSPGGYAIWPSTLAAVLLATLAVTMIHRALLGIVDGRTATLGAMVFAFATPTWSVSAEWLLPHALTQAGIAGSALAATRDRWWLTGAALAVGITGRAHLAVLAAVLGLGVAFVRKRPSIALAVGVPSVVGVGVVVATNAWRYGTPSLQGAQTYTASNLVDSSTGAWADWAINIVGFTVSPGRGLLMWTPLAVVLAPAVVRSFRSSPDWSRFMLLGGLAYTLVQLKINNFSGGDSFVGYRLGLELVTSGVAICAVAWRRGLTDRTRLFASIAVWFQFVMVAVAAIAPASAGLYLTFTPLEHPWRQHILLVAANRTPMLLATVVVTSAIGFVTVRRLAQITQRHVPTPESAPRPPAFQSDPGAYDVRPGSGSDSGTAASSGDR